MLIIRTTKIGWVIAALLPDNQMEAITVNRG